MPSAMAEVTAAERSSGFVSQSTYHSKLRAKREERLQQQQQHQPQQIHHAEPSSVPDLHATATVVGLGPSGRPNSASLDAVSSPVTTTISTSRTTARSFAAEDVRRRERADARRLLIDYRGTVWDVVRTNDMAMLRNFFLVEGAAKMVHAHSKQADEFGRTLLHTAAWWGRVEIATYLISNGATLNQIDSVTTRLTPLMDAARAGQSEIGLLLLEHEADVTVRDASGDNAFHWAARHSRGTFLLQMSLKLLALDRALLVSLWTAKNPRGRTPVDYIRAHPTVFPMISKRLGAHVPLHRATASSTHRRRRSANGPASDRSRTHADANAANPTLDSDGSRPATAQSEAVPLSGVDVLGLDVGTFAYKSRDAVSSR